MGNVENSEIPKWFYRVFGILVVINVSLVTYATRVLHNLEVSVAVIEATRFTPEKAAPIYQAITKLTASVADINTRFAKLPDQYPPQWFLEYTKDTRDLARENSRRVQTIEQKISNQKR